MRISDWSSDVCSSDLFEPGEMMPLDRGDFLWRERARPLGGHASDAAVALMPPRAPGDLRHFGHGQPALAVAVELAQAREGDMRDVHVEPHADRLGSDPIIDLAGPAHPHLRRASAAP